MTMVKQHGGKVWLKRMVKQYGSGARLGMVEQHGQGT
jgi:hypothetical protein